MANLLPLKRDRNATPWEFPFKLSALFHRGFLSRKTFSLTAETCTPFWSPRSNRFSSACPQPVATFVAPPLPHLPTAAAADDQIKERFQVYRSHRRRDDPRHARCRLLCLQWAGFRLIYLRGNTEVFGGRFVPQATGISWHVVSENWIVRLIYITQQTTTLLFECFVLLLRI